MYAEALYPAIESLPESEQQKIFETLKKALSNPVQKVDKEPMLTDAQARAYLIKNFLKKKRKI